MLPNIAHKPNEPLSSYTTFQLGGPCRALIDCATSDELKKAVSELAKENLPFILIGGGSNLLVSDTGVDCYVVRYVSPSPLIERKDTTLIVGAGTNLDALAYYAAENGLSGVNCTSGIPGTVGGAVVGNAGAFGKQIGDVVISVEVLTPKGESKTIPASELGFVYRSSALKETSDIVVSVTLKLQDANASELLKEREEILALRRSKHPDLRTHPCAGSFFRNVEPTSSAGKRQAAGWFLDEAGAKALSVGGAKIFEKHANIIVKSEGCSAEDVLTLSRQMAELVKAKFDIELVREVRLIGQFNSLPSASFIS